MEKWKSWKPIEGLPVEFYKDSLTDDKNGLSLLFEGRSDSKKFSVIFDKGVLSYRNTDEGSLLQMMGFLLRTMEKLFLEKRPYLK